MPEMVPRKDKSEKPKPSPPRCVVCIACGGTGKNSHGKMCYPCLGTGVKR